MADYYSNSPTPAPGPPAEGQLPYPWITQFDPTHQATFYVNLETQESSWTYPDLSNFPGPGVAPAVQGTRGMSDNNAYYGGGAATSQNYPSSGSAGGGGGEAASFYGSSGTTPQAPGQTTYSAPSEQQYDANGQPVEGERGLGKIIVGGGAMYMAYKMYKDYQKGKLSKQQFKPPNPNNITPQLHDPHQNYPNVYYPQNQFGPPKRDNALPAPTPNWDQKPAAYNGAPPAPYNAGAQFQPYGQASSSYAQQQPPVNYGSSPAPYNGGGAQPYSQPPQYDASQYGYGTAAGHSAGYSSPTKSGWGDPRLS